MTNELDKQLKEVGKILEQAKVGGWVAKESAQFILHRHGPELIPTMYAEITKLREQLKQAVGVLEWVKKYAPEFIKDEIEHSLPSLSQGTEETK